jgi:proliferating cell nuclear antigen PCNA
MEAVTIQGEKIKQLFEVLKDILEDVNLVFGPEGIQINTFDPEKVAYVKAFLLADKFDRYKCPHPIHVGIPMSTLYKTLKPLGSNTDLVLKIDSSMPDHLYICMCNEESKHLYETTLRLKLIPPEKTNVPVISFNRYMSLSSKKMQEDIGVLSNLLSAIDETEKIVDIEMLDNQLRFTVEGDFGISSISISPTHGGLSVKHLNIDPLSDLHVFDGESPVSDTVGTKRTQQETEEEKEDKEEEDDLGASIAASVDRIKENSVSSEESVKFPFNLKYIKYFTKSALFSQRVRICLRPGLPLVLQYTVGTLGHVCFLLGKAVADEM